MHSHGGGCLPIFPQVTMSKHDATRLNSITNGNKNLVETRAALQKLVVHKQLSGSEKFLV